jgi:hypothetical protein
MGDSLSGAENEPRRAPGGHGKSEPSTRLAEARG